MISALTWVKKGANKEYPTRYSHDTSFNNEIDNDSDDDMNDIDDQDNNNDIPSVLDPETEAITKKYNLNSYDDEDDDICLVPPTYYSSEKQDPILKNIEDDDEDIDDLIIKDTDTVLVTATTEDDQFSHVNVYIYENTVSNLYIHHDIVLPSFPLCIEWMEYHTPYSTNNNEDNDNNIITGTNNTIAVGTFNPEIEIWDLDLLDALTPLATLGGIEEEDQFSDVASFSKMSKNQKRKRKKQMAERAAKRKLKDKSHTDAVMALSWNSTVTNILASGSADKTVKIWDMNTQQCLNTYNHHNEKVQACCWHPTESNLLLTSGYDKSAVIMDIRSPSEVFRWKLTADVERVEWNPHKPQEFLISTEDGIIKKFDSLSPKDTLFTLHAHNGSVGGLSLNKIIPNCLATCSDDKSFKIWDISDNKPSMVYENDSPNTQLFALSWDRNSPNLLAIGGKNHLQVVDVSKIEIIVKHFSS